MATPVYKFTRPKWANGALEFLIRNRVTEKGTDEQFPITLAARSGDSAFIGPSDSTPTAHAAPGLQRPEMDHAQVDRFVGDRQRVQVPWLALGIMRAWKDMHYTGWSLSDWSYDLATWVRTGMITDKSQPLNEQVRNALAMLRRDLAEATFKARDSGALPARDPGCQVRHLGPHVSETWRAQFPGFRYLVSPTSVKIDKSNAAQERYLNAVMYLAPATMAGGPNLCPCHTEGCFGEAGENCIAGTGRLEMATEVLIGRSHFFFGAPERFLERLTTEIEHFVNGARACGRKLALRLNGTSDVDWERRAGFRGLFERFPDVTFYDYTKVANRVVRGGRQIPLPKNYHLTFSLSEENDEQALEVATHTDVNIAVVFDVAPPRGEFPGGNLPKVFGGRRVIDGDKHDLRFLDPRGVVVGLRLKTLAHARREQMIIMGFVKPAGAQESRGARGHGGTGGENMSEQIDIFGAGVARDPGKRFTVKREKKTKAFIVWDGKHKRPTGEHSMRLEQAEELATIMNRFEAEKQGGLLPERMAKRAEELEADAPGPVAASRPTGKPVGEVRDSGAGLDEVQREIARRVAADLKIDDAGVARDSGCACKHESGCGIVRDVSSTLYARDPGADPAEKPTPIDAPTTLDHLPDLELLSHLLPKSKAKKLLLAADRLALLAQWTLPELVSRGGLSEKEAHRLHAGLLVGRRGSTQVDPLHTVSHPSEVVGYLRAKIGVDRRREHFVALLLDVKFRVKRYVLVSTGSLSATMVHPRDVFGPALADHAHAIIVAHNHPSGSVEPSPEDVILTRRLVRAGNELGIKVLDSLIVNAEGDYFSLEEAGRLNP